MRITRTKILLALGALVMCVAVAVAGVKVCRDRAASKAIETRRFLEAKVRYATGAERKETQVALLKHIMATTQPPEASMALFELIRTYPEVGKQDEHYSANALLTRFPGTAGANLWKAQALSAKGQYQEALPLLTQDKLYQSAPYTARYEQTRLLCSVARELAFAATDPQQSRDLFERALTACNTLAMRTGVANDIGMAHLFKARTLFLRAKKFNVPADADEACRLANQIKDIPDMRSPYLLNEGPKRLVEEVRKWRASQAR